MDEPATHPERCLIHVLNASNDQKTFEKDTRGALTGGDLERSRPELHVHVVISDNGNLSPGKGH